MTHLKLCAVATVLALTTSAVSPAALEAQRRQPTGVVRPVPALSQWGESCAAKKVLTVGSATMLGWLIGFFVTMVYVPVAVAIEAKSPGSNLMFGGMALGLAAGLVVAFLQPCDR